MRGGFPFESNLKCGVFDALIERALPTDEWSGLHADRSILSLLHLDPLAQRKWIMHALTVLAAKSSCALGVPTAGVAPTRWTLTSYSPSESPPIT